MGAGAAARDLNSLPRNAAPNDLRNESRSDALSGAQDSLSLTIPPGSPGANLHPSIDDPLSNNPDASGPVKSDSLNAPQSAMNAESVKMLKALRPQKLSEGDHEFPGAAGSPLGPYPEARDGIGVRAKAAVQPPPVPAAPAEKEVAGPTPLQPVHSVSLRLATAASAPVDVQVAARAGKLQVAVRTADPDLAKSLQGNLGELVGRLEEKGFRADVWTPAAAPHGPAPAREPSTSPDSQGHSDQSGSWSGQPGSRQGQEESSQQRPGRWKTHFAETLGAQHAPTQAGA